MRTPAFWAHGCTPPWPLPALSGLYAAFTANRMAKPGWTAPVPVICCGNATSGGAGKTPLALDIGTRLLARGLKVAFLTRGHGGRLRGPLRVHAARHDSNDVGDETLLLNAVAPVYVGANRAKTARMALDDGAQVLVMDDGLQNPALAKTLAFLVIDGGAGFGNGRVIPAGPLREPVARAAARCQAAIMIGPDVTGALNGALDSLARDLTILRAQLLPDAGDLEGMPPRLLAFAGIGRPQKFFDTLAAAGCNVVATRSFADHYPYSSGDLASLHVDAWRLNANLVTTAKDFIRLSPVKRGDISRLRVALAWDDEDGIENLLTRVLVR